MGSEASEDGPSLSWIIVVVLYQCLGSAKKILTALIPGVTQNCSSRGFSATSSNFEFRHIHAFLQATMENNIPNIFPRHSCGN